MLETLNNNLQQTVKSGSLQTTALPNREDISLYLISKDYPRGRLPQEEMLAILEKPAYWAFCWASGLVLADSLKRSPNLCAGKSVLDLGAGSGVVAIAAAKAGAARVIACDIDQHALDACRANAELNHVSLEILDDLAKLDQKVDLLIAADVLYDRENLPWLDTLVDYADEILIADSRIRDKSLFDRYDLIDEQQATTVPDLDELKEFGEVSIYYRG
ncbi:MAG: methyltransferase [Gammaproteobacteria bacterium]|nr:methyltransferase [Gammaproteobacteria bacterium]MBT4494292.1 methyltransferase [Gammaproteobacteria bacterium]MBT7370607.1 methyltransferase [Gammaproteobacteria bacterium]